MIASQNQYKHRYQNVCIESEELLNMNSNYGSALTRESYLRSLKAAKLAVQRPCDRQIDFEIYRSMTPYLIQKFISS